MPDKTPTTPKTIEELNAEVERQRLEFRIESLKARTTALTTPTTTPKKSWAETAFSPVGVAVMSALVALTGQVYNGYQNVALEKSKQESALILKTAEVADLKVRAANLVFFAEAGYLKFNAAQLQSLRTQAGLTVKDAAPPPSIPVTTPTATVADLSQLIDELKKKGLSLPEVASRLGEAAQAKFNESKTGSQKGRKIAQIAIDELKKGIFEPSYKSRSSTYDKYFRDLQINKTESWCGAFVCWCVTQLEADSIQPTALNENLVNQFKRKGYFYTYSANSRQKPVTGDIYFRKKGNKHPVCGIVIKFEETKDGPVLWSVDGNTSYDNSSVGYMVAYKERTNFKQGTLEFVHLPD